MPTVPSYLDRLVLESTIHDLPPYLFRCFSDASASSGSRTSIGPRALPKPFDSHTIEVLSCHLHWGRELDSEFVSWTESILVALVHAIRRKEGMARDDPGTGVYLAILDTKLAIQQAPIYHAGAILDAFGFSKEGYFKRDKFSSEFLSHGWITNEPGVQRFGLATIEELLHRHFYRVFEPFQNPDRRLWQRMDEVRQKFSHQVVTHTGLHNIAHMARCFDLTFRLPIAIALTALFSYDESSRKERGVILSEIFKDMVTPSRIFFWYRYPTDEVGRCYNMLSEVRHLRFMSRHIATTRYNETLSGMPPISPLSNQVSYLTSIQAAQHHEKLNNNSEWRKNNAIETKVARTSSSHAKDVKESEARQEAASAYEDLASAFEKWSPESFKDITSGYRKLALAYRKMA
ncbi:hypothetical protein D6D01_00285 [Aureobasidium pullulans]|uniref:DUF7587 domain-containing protein n=1 Tax=Aureobasidium pullulans TaxID=5580 RepID=A0A4S9M426_AURPU|nr:hypothetical protein D6D01_00285 [Aureobasidium pullulans]